MGTYYLVRHGETDANRTGILQGYMDVPLSQTGRKQAEVMAQALAGVAFAVVYSSDLSRAADTAALISACRACPLIVDAGIKEINCGMLQGKTFPQVGELWPDVYSALKADPMDAPRPGGESYREFYNRTVSAFDRIVAANPDSVVAVVTHGGVIRNILAHAKGRPVDPGEPAFANCSISIVTSENGPQGTRLKVAQENVVDHLLALGSDPREASKVYHW